MGDIRVVREGACYVMHDASPQGIPCLASYQSMLQGLVCTYAFFYLLKKVNKAHKRALAGYAKNTINISSHSHAFFGCIVFYVFWGIGCIFDLNREFKYDDLTSPGILGTDVITLTPLIIGSTICRSFTNFLESYIVVLLISDSIGKDTFRRAIFISLFLTCFYVPSILIVIIWYPGLTSTYWPLRNLAILYLIRDIITVGYHAVAYAYIKGRKSQHASSIISNYLLFMCCLYSSYIFARILYLTSNMIAVNFGICIDDFLHFVQFFFFGPFVYLALKRDCQYWATDIDNENELTLMSHTENMAWSEINDKSDAIIPKSEIYYRKMIEERCDVSVEIHFWRRRQVVVKRFKLDLLTRDNIKYFKDEASVFKTLHHPNVIAFYGILVDPPSLGIVMQYASRGDLFKYLEGKLEAWKSGIKEESSSILKFVGGADNPMRNSIQEESECDDLDDEKRDNDEIPPPPSSPSFMMTGSSPRLTISPGTPGSGSPSSFMSRLTRTSFFVNSPLSPSAAAIEMTNRLGQFHCIRCALQIAMGMNYLHNNNVCHRDLKSLNILLDDKYNAMIADFGESKFEEDIQFRDSSTVSGSSGLKNVFNPLRIKSMIHRLLNRDDSENDGIDAEHDETKREKNTHHHHRGEVGTPGWAAPECLSGSLATKSSDVFSFGIILWELCTWIHPSIHVPVLELMRDPLRTLPGVEDWIGNGVELTADDVIPQKKRHSLSKIFGTLVGEDPDSLRTGRLSRLSLEKRISQMNPMKLILIEACDADRARKLMLELNKRPPIPNKCHPLLISIMLRCWALDQSSRPSFSDIVDDLQKALADLNCGDDSFFPLGLGGGGEM